MLLFFTDILDNFWWEYCHYFEIDFCILQNNKRVENNSKIDSWVADLIIWYLRVDKIPEISEEQFS